MKAEKQPSAKIQIERLAFSIQETATALGVSYHSIYRLIQRGELRANTKLRHKLIPRAEIERFLTKS